jgi:hypothetical protein
MVETQFKMDKDIIMIFKNAHNAIYRIWAK